MSRIALLTIFFWNTIRLSENHCMKHQRWSIKICWCSLYYVRPDEFIPLSKHIILGVSFQLTSLLLVFSTTIEIQASVFRKMSRMLINNHISCVQWNSWKLFDRWKEGRNQEKHLRYGRHSIQSKLVLSSLLDQCFSNFNEHKIASQNVNSVQ